MADEGSVVVYAGSGSSHSWTWLADLFERQGILRARFLDEREFPLHLVSQSRCAIVSGGDGFEIARALSGTGFRSLKDYITGGGLYAGMCAGAYLPLRSSLVPFSEFNLSDTRIENITQRDTISLGVPLRVAVPYGSCSVVHPVRGELMVRWGEESVVAPIYGGPVFREPYRDRVLARYSGFTDGTEFQMSRAYAEKTIQDRPACIEASVGKGRLLLFGPHFEHPRYPDANALFSKSLGLAGSTLAPRDGVGEHADLDRAIADLKVAIVGLENRSFVVGRKIWDGSRYLELVRAIEDRSWTMDCDLANEVSTSLWRVRDDVRSMKIGIESDADRTTQLLVESARACVDDHFQALARGR